VGMDGANRGTGTFEVWVDGVKKWESGRLSADDRAEPVRVEVNGAAELCLRVGDGGDGIVGDHANWAEARLLR
ncbi:MAG TPA: NPCBM/NEW2 domain-containing protein, partial [Candidatus Hydrogenedentes bacterium]|nr:NPCBM/NEW2 domain-containing protein [Candidatus Hydrogenedentota bacterium]